MDLPDLTNTRGQRLSARLDRPSGAPRAFALFAHCFTCSKDLRASAGISAALVDAGFAVLRFDFTGLGSSEGEFAQTSFSTNVDDLLAAAGYLARAAETEAPALLVGHSLGGAAVIRAAASLPTVRAVATIAAPAHPRHVIPLLRTAPEELAVRGEAVVELAGRPFTITQRFLEDLREQPMREAIAGLGRPLLILHAPSDETVGLDNATKIFVAARHPKSFVALDGADHLLTRREDARFVGELIAVWARRAISR